MDVIGLFVLAIAAIATIAALLYVLLIGYCMYSFRYWQSRGILFEKPKSFRYGNFEDVGEKIHLAEFTKNLYDKFKSTGEKLCGLYFCTCPVAMILDVELVKEILITDFPHFNERGLYFNKKDDPLTAHLFSLNGDEWRKLRQKAAPIFSPAKMKLTFPSVVEVAEQFKDCLFNLTSPVGVQLEMKDLLARFTTDVIGTCVFGIECNSLTDSNAEFRRYGRDLFEKPRHSVYFRRLMDEHPKFFRMLHWKKIPDDIAKFFMNVIRYTVNYREDNNIRRNDFMDLLIQLKNNNDDERSITFNELAALAFVFFQAGFESSSSTLAFCLYELAQNPDIQTKARRIIQETYTKYNEKFTYEMIDMPYIDQILKETLRLYSPASYMPRVTQEDYHVRGTDIVIEKGTKVIIPVHAIHNDPEYYPNPEVFDPDRFRNDDQNNRDAMCWLGFGGGPRNCIGMQFGKMQARIGLIMLLQNFEFSLGADMTVPILINKKIALYTPQELYLNLRPL